MFSLYEGFVGYEPVQRNTLFSASDSKDKFDKNLSENRIEPYYLNKTISYQRNSLGHRCRNINQIDLDNYILFVGCSATEGIGLSLEDTYPYLLSQKLGMDYYNLSLAGIGTEVMFHNLSTWIMKVKKAPKFLVWQWQMSARFSTLEDDRIKNIGSWESDDRYLQALIHLDSLRVFEFKNSLVNNFLQELKKQVIVLEVFHHKEKVITDYSVHFRCLDRARDLSHYGHLSNLDLSESLALKIYRNI